MFIVLQIVLQNAAHFVLNGHCHALYIIALYCLGKGVEKY